MKPHKIFLTFLSILALIALIAYFFPSGGVVIPPGIQVNFPSLKSLINQEQVQYKDISSIVENNRPIDTIAPVINDTLTRGAGHDTTDIQQDSAAPAEQDTTAAPTRKPDRPRLKENRQKELQYPAGDPSVLYPFFRSLEKLPGKERLIRILHYGDSQIEGDRISSYLRNQLQKQFGGAGIGLFPMVLPNNTNIALRHSVTRNWSRFTPHDLDEANFRHERFGVLMSFSRFSPYYSYYQDEVYEGSITLSDSPISFDLNSQFTRCRIFFGYNEKPFIVKMNYDGQTRDADMIPATDTLREITWEVPSQVDELTITFQGTHSPDIYGMALDDKRGIALDNIPLRGSSGTEFTRYDTTFLKSMMNQLNVKMIVMHFGVNLVPLIREDYTFYENRFYRQLKTLKSLNEDISIIVMGVTDMSRKEGGNYRSWPNIEKIRDAQKNAAFRAGCAFWDTYEAMGGRNSMPSWVFSNPPLARKDFTHFTYKGSVVVAKMFYKALMKDYRNYQKQVSPGTGSAAADAPGSFPAEAGLPDTSGAGITDSLKEAPSLHQGVRDSSRQ